jgi:hypothetical protein
MKTLYIHSREEMEEALVKGLARGSITFIDVSVFLDYEDLVNKEDTNAP